MSLRVSNDIVMNSSPPAPVDAVDAAPLPRGGARAAGAAGARVAYARVVEKRGVTADRVEGAPVATAFDIEADGQRYGAIRAVSCLVEPAPGDTVLASTDGAGAWHVLSVLEREHPRATTLSTDGDLAIHLPSGKLDVVTKDGAAVTSGGPVEVVSPRLVAQAAEADVRFETIEASGRTAQVLFEAVKLSVEGAELFADRVTTRARQALRILTELDQLRAKCVDYVAKKSMRMHAENTVVTAEGIAKVDAKNIHLG